MRFFAFSTDDDGMLTGHATNDRRDPARAFCDAYRTIAARLIDKGALRLEPCFWGKPDTSPPTPGEPLRLHLTEEDQPGLFAAVFDCLGADPGDDDVVVAMREEMLAAPLDPLSLASIVIQDAACVVAANTLCDHAGDEAAAELARAAAASLLTRAAEASGLAAPGAYDEICASAVEALMRPRYDGRRNAEALFVRENPGLASRIKAVVDMARQGDPPSLPLDPFTLSPVVERVLNAMPKGWSPAVAGAA